MAADTSFQLFRFNLQTNQTQGVQIHIEEAKQCIPLAQYSRPINQTQLQFQLIFQLSSSEKLPTKKRFPHCNRDFFAPS